MRRSVLIALVGVALLLTSTASLGIVLVEVGMLAAIVFALLALFSVITSVSVLGVALGRRLADYRARRDERLSTRVSRSRRSTWSRR